MHWRLIFNLQPATLLKKRRRHTYFFVNFANFFTSNFVTEKLLRIGFERRILQKRANRHSYYKESFQKTEIVREKVYWRTTDRKLIVTVIFHSFTDISFLKDFTNTFFLSYCAQEKIWEYFKVQLSVALSVCFTK